MPARFLFGLALLLIPLGLASCVPTGSGAGAEDKCPYYVEGRDRLAKQDPSGAKRAFEKALEVNPRSALAHYELGLLNEQHLRNYVVAVYHYQRALELRPEGYPADNAKVRIRSCRQELVKEESLSPLDRGLVRDMERLRTENAQLRQQLEQLQQRLTQRTPDPLQDSETRSADASRSGGTGSPSGSTRGGVHVVKKGDTAYSIARARGLSLRELQAANPGVRLERIVPGQRLRIP